MVVLLDTLGEWKNLGTVTPDFFEWSDFPVLAESEFRTFRFTFIGDFQTINKYLYPPIYYFVRPVYEPGSSTKAVGSTKRVYPSEDPLILELLLSSDLEFQPVQKQIQIQKHSRWRFNQSIQNIQMQVKLEEFSPYEEYRQLPLNQSTLQQIATLFDENNS